MTVSKRRKQRRRGALKAVRREERRAERLRASARESVAFMKTVMYAPDAVSEVLVVIDDPYPQSRVL